MRVSAIAAMGQNRIIGHNNDLAWELPDDFQYFKDTTMGYPILMGRKTFQALGRPLPRRENIVITRHGELPHTEGIVVCYHLEEGLAKAKALALETWGVKEIFVIGGGEIYRQAMPWTNRLHLTFIDGRFEGDTTFPEVDFSQWELVEERRHPADERHAYSFRFTVWDRLVPARPLPDLPVAPQG
jgi:dihydrofolate reductase